MRLTIRDLQAYKKRGEKLPMLTAYDYPFANLIERAGIPIILVGDSVGDNVLGYDNTVPVTVEDITHHLRAVVRGTETAHIVADMPFMSYQTNIADALRNAGTLLKSGAQSVKLEGGRRLVDTVKELVAAGIPVMGHIGLTPQSVNQFGGYRVQGRTQETAQKLIEDAVALEAAGVYALVLETVPEDLARTVTGKIQVPTIGIGAGIHCDGQVLVIHDILGIQPGREMKHARKYADLAQVISEATTQYIADVQSGGFPSHEESFKRK